MTDRRAITPLMKLQCLLYRFRHDCGLCNMPITEFSDLEWDHIHALVHGGDHSYTNLRPVHAECHKAKTARDIAANAKVKRLRGETCNGPKKQIQSRGFDKTKSRKFNGKVVERVVAQDGEVYPASPDDEIEFPAPRGMD